MSSNHLGTADMAMEASTDQLVNAEKPKKSRKKIWIIIGLIVLLLAIAGGVVGALAATDVISFGSSSNAIAEGATSAEETDGSQGSEDASQDRDEEVDTSDDKDENNEDDDDDDDDEEEPKAMVCTDKDDIPSDAKGTWLDPTSWLDLDDFNCTYTSETIGDLPVVGLMSDYNDSARANPNVPALDEDWGSYLERPARGVNLGGWFSLEPFITPSLFDYDSDLGIVDEYTLSEHLGDKAVATLEKHYSTYITEDDFKQIADAGLDHLRIPFSYWAVTTYDEDPYPAGLSWRYLLRALEWARKYGLRVKLDLHGLPGSQNGWNHSGRSSKVNFIIGTDGAKNAQRALDVHDRLSKFFAQPRYDNVVAFYGLANEPAKAIDSDKLIEWTEEAFEIVSGNGLSAPQVFSESFRGVGWWNGKLTGHGDELVIDAHNYIIFSSLISMSRADKVSFACTQFADQTTSGVDPSTGFGPAMVGEWSVADTDCVKYLNGVGGGNRWEGTYDGGGPMCPAADDSCSCDMVNGDPEHYPDAYKLFLRTFAIAQMDAYENSWGWFYWTWKAETAAQWSYKHGLDNAYLPEKAYDRGWSCSDSVPDFEGLSGSE